MAKRNGTHDLDVTVQCPACHEYGVFHTWDVIDTADAKLSERVHFDENLFFYTCPHCHAKIHMESKCLYIDRDKKLLVWHIPGPKNGSRRRKSRMPWVRRPSRPIPAGLP